MEQAIPGTLMLDYGAPDMPFDADALALDGAALLFPDGEAADVRPHTLVIVDGSWPQARKMSRRVPGLAALPRLHLTPKDRPPSRLRRPPVANGMATIEAVARALHTLEGPGPAEALDTLFARFVDTHRRLRGRVRPHK